MSAFTTRDPDTVATSTSSACWRVGHLYLDVPGRRLYLLNDTARQLRAEGIPCFGNEPAREHLLSSAGEPARAEDLPLVIASREGRPAEAGFLLARPQRPACQLFWSASPLKNQAGQVSGVLASVCCGPPAPDWHTLAGLAHDLRSPLQTLSFVLAVLDRRPSAVAQQEATLQRLRSAAERALQVAADLVEWCRDPGHGGRRIEQTWLHLTPLLASLVEEQQPEARRKGLKLGMALEEATGWQLCTDRVRLGRILTNLLANAVRYTPPSGQVTLTATWRQERGERPLVLGVADTGAGITPEEQESIFQPFERGRTGRQGDSSGSGLGLAIVDQLVAELGLRREIYSEHGRGSTFRLLLPQRLLRFAPHLDSPAK
jgi:two-component sensor histidine kinase